MPWGIAAAAVVGAYSASQQSKAAKSAANAQANSANQANDTQLQMFNQSRQDQAPFRQAGLVGLNQYMDMLGIGGNQPQYGQTAAGTYNGQAASQNLVDMSGGIPAPNAGLYSSDPAYAAAWNQVLGNQLDRYHQGYGVTSNPGQIQSDISAIYKPASNGVGPVGHETATPANMGGAAALAPEQSQQDAFAAFRAAPGYQFGLDEGAKTVQASAAAKGGLNSGATLKALTKFGNDYADQQGYTPYMNRLAALSGMAQTSTNTTGQLGANVANQIGQNIRSAGQARAQGIYGSANAWSNYGQQLSSSMGNIAAQNDWGGV